MGSEEKTSTAVTRRASLKRDDLVFSSLTATIHGYQIRYQPRNLKTLSLATQKTPTLEDIAFPRWKNRPGYA